MARVIGTPLWKLTGPKPNPNPNPNPDPNPDPNPNPRPNPNQVIGTPLWIHSRHNNWLLTKLVLCFITNKVRVRIGAGLGLGPTHCIPTSTPTLTPTSTT